jgi:ubiquinol-cytochrome c reductase cytochrome b/c1 subunit
MRTALGLSLAASLLLASGALADTANSEPEAPRHDVHWSFEGPMGLYDPQQLQRGFQVYKEVCSACHSLNRVAFHTLSEPGGPGFTEEQAKAIAATYKIPADPNDQGELFDSSGNRLTRPGTIADYFTPPFANEQAARAANNGALPPDLSVIVKAREGGPNYVFSILTGFGKTPPAGFHVLDGKYYNPWFAGRNISMPPPLTDGSVTYADGTKATVEQEAQDVVAFLEWSAEPKMDERKQIGFGAMIFLIFLSGLAYLAYRRLWRDMH